MPLPDIDITQIEDEKMRHLIGGLLNIIDDLRTEVRAVRAENQRLRDENNRLKGEQGKPKIKAKKTPKNHSSEQERRQSKSKKHQKKSKRSKIKIDRQETLEVDRAHLPSDARFKGYQEVVVQDIQISTDNILFRKEKFYSKSRGQTYLAPLPAGYKGEFGPRVRTQVLVLYYAGQMTEVKIHEWLSQVGMHISLGQISNMLIKKHDVFHQEASASYKASLEACPWQHIDDTGTRVNGDNQYCHLVDNPVATHYRTLPSKSRLTVLKVLLNQKSLKFRLNQEALELLDKLKVPQKSIQLIKNLPREQDLEEAFIYQWIDSHLPNLNHTQQQAVLSALAIAAYHAQTDFPIVKLLICDNAPQGRI